METEEQIARRKAKEQARHAKEATLYGVFAVDNNGQHEQICLTYCRDWADRIAAALGKDIPAQDQGETN